MALKRAKSPNGLEIVHDDYKRKVVEDPARKMDELNHNLANKEILAKKQRFEQDAYKKLKVHVKRSNNPAKQPILQIHGYESIGRVANFRTNSTRNKARSSRIFT